MAERKSAESPKVARLLPLWHSKTHISESQSWTEIPGESHNGTPSISLYTSQVSARFCELEETVRRRTDSTMSLQDQNPLTACLRPARQLLSAKANAGNTEMRSLSLCARQTYSSRLKSPNQSAKQISSSLLSTHPRKYGAWELGGQLM